VRYIKTTSSSFTNLIPPPSALTTQRRLSDQTTIYHHDTRCIYIYKYIPSYCVQSSSHSVKQPTLHGLKSNNLASLTIIIPSLSHHPCCTALAGENTLPSGVLYLQLRNPVKESSPPPRRTKASRARPSLWIQQQGIVVCGCFGQRFLSCFASQVRTPFIRLPPTLQSMA
jgi:hypothetical protein